LVSSPGKGSTFTLYLPQSYVPQKVARRPAAAPTENGSARLAPEPPPAVTPAPARPPLVPAPLPLPNGSDSA